MRLIRWAIVARAIALTWFTTSANPLIETGFLAFGQLEGYSTCCSEVGVIEATCRPDGGLNATILAQALRIMIAEVAI